MEGLVSVIIPVHNGERFLAAAVESVRQQGYPALECIVVDDGSTDGTADLIARLGGSLGPLVSERQPRRGPAAARNRGLAVARGEFIAFLDADDLWPRGKLHAQVGRLREDPLLDVVLGRVQPIHSIEGAGSERRLAGPVISVQLGSAVFRRGVFDRVGPFDDSLSFSEDHDWFLHAREQRARVAVMDRVTLLHRRHQGNMTRGQARHGYQLTRVLKASLDRRRAQGAGAARSLPPLTDVDEARSVAQGAGQGV